MDREQEVQRILAAAEAATRTGIRGLGLLLALLAEIRRLLDDPGGVPVALDEVQNPPKLRLIQGGKE